MVEEVLNVATVAGFQNGRGFLMRFGFLRRREILPDGRRTAEATDRVTTYSSSCVRFHRFRVKLAQLLFFFFSFFFLKSCIISPEAI